MLDMLKKGDLYIHTNTGVVHEVLAVMKAKEEGTYRVSLLSLMTDQETTIDCDKDGFLSEFEKFEEIELEELREPIDIVLDIIARSKTLAYYNTLKFGFEMTEALLEDGPDKYKKFYDFAKSVTEGED